MEDYKELGHEYRYRDQLMVQEFHLAVLAVSLLLNAAILVDNYAGSLIIQAFGLAFLLTLTLHLSSINHDRIATLRNKDKVRDSLGFSTSHQNVSGSSRISSPRLMVWLAALAAVAWMIWLLVSVVMVASNYNLSIPRDTTASRIEG